MSTRKYIALAAGLILLIGILACGSDNDKPKYTVGGTVTGLTGDLTLQCNGTDDLVVTKDGTFTFGTPIKKGTAYEVTIAGQPYRQICGVTANGSGTVPGSDITSVQVECVTADVIARVNTTIEVSYNVDVKYTDMRFISGDGRYVAFRSKASDLVPGDTNGYEDIFVHDRLTGETTRVSVASDGTEGNSASFGFSISEDGRYVAFTSFSTNLVAGDANDTVDIFVHDRLTGETTRASVVTDGMEGNDLSVGPSISGDGRYVSFRSQASNLVNGDTNLQDDIFVHDRQTGETTRVSVASDGTEANEWSYSHSISGDGRYVAFNSWASNLVSGDTNNASDVFVHDRQTGETTRVSVSSDGTQAEDFNDSWYPSISGDGRYVAFESSASNLVAGDTNNRPDFFVHDRQTGETTRVSVASDGTEGYDNSSTYYVRGGLFISGDGRYVAFESVALNLVAGDTNSSRDIFVHDRQTGETKRVSVAEDGTEGNADSYLPSISGDGRYVAFGSSASNLVAGDTNGLDDIFVTPVR